MVLCHRHGSTSCCPGRLVCSGTQGIPAWCEKNCQFQVGDVGELYLGKMKVMVVMVVLPPFRLNWTSFICHESGLIELLQHRPVKRKHHPLPMCIWSSGSCPPTGLVLDLSKNWGSGVIAISQSLSHIHRFWEYLLTIMDPKEAPKNWRIRSKLLGHGLALILCSAIFQAGSSVMESASIIWTKQHFRTDLWPITIWIYMEVCKNPAPIRLVFHDPPWAIFSFHSKKR